jgi:hypothetical protein
MRFNFNDGGRSSAGFKGTAGVYIAQQAGHYVCVIDGVPQDIWDCSEKMVYGYWRKA